MRTKEFLSARAVEYVSVNVADDPAGLAQMTALGARSVPVVARGSDFIYAQDLGAVSRFVGIAETERRMLAPGTLVARLTRVLAIAQGLLEQIPPTHLADKLPGRDRSYLALGNHIVAIAAGYLAVTRGHAFTGEIAAAVPTRELAPVQLRDESRRNAAAIASWWQSIASRDGVAENAAASVAAHPAEAMSAAATGACAREVETFYGPQPLHALLERCTWHVTQHTRQLMMVLQTLAISPTRPLGAEDLVGLPLPENVWDG